MTQADPPGARALTRHVWRGGWAEPGERRIAEERPVALVHDGSTTAVMMATPADLEDFGVGFSLTEGLVEAPDQIRRIELAHSDLGTEVRLWLEPGRADLLAARRRRLAGPTGCGLCGVESLAEAMREPPPVAADIRLRPEQVAEAVRALTAAQALGAATRAVHAAGWWSPDAGLVAVREDVGRHNALDKLVGALRRGVAPPPGAVVLTSRVSGEMIQKSAVLGAPVVIAVSAPTALAVEAADKAGVTLVAVAREDGFEVFTRPDRLAAGRE